MASLSIYELLLALSSYFSIVDRGKRNTGQDVQLQIHEERYNQPVELQVDSAGATKAILGKPLSGYSRVVTGGFITLSGGAARSFQVYMQNGDRTYPLSNASTLGKNLRGTLNMVGDDTLVVAVAAAANATTLLGHLSYYDVLSTGVR